MAVAIRRSVTILLGLLLSTSVFSEQMYSPICFQDRPNKREVILLGVSHFLRYQPHVNGIVEKLLDKSNLVFFENAKVLPKDGIFRSTMAFPEEAKQPVKLERFVDVRDMPELTNLFGMSYSSETSIPLASVITFVESILARKLIQTTGSNGFYKGNPFSQIIDSYNVESASYAYALANRTQVH